MTEQERIDKYLALYRNAKDEMGLLNTPGLAFMLDYYDGVMERHKHVIRLCRMALEGIEAERQLDEMEKSGFLQHDLEAVGVRQGEGLITPETGTQCCPGDQ